MFVEKLPPPIWVATESSLQTMMADLMNQPRVAVDTEANSLHAYQEQVCLIQFSTPDRDYLLDPFAFAGLEPLAPLFASPHIEKILHAAEYDLLGLKRDYKFEFASLFDTMQAARILGTQKVGLDAILNERFGISLNKRFQKADWGARPLSHDQLEYARLDTRYLIPLRDLLKIDLEARGRWELAREDFQRACETNINHAEAPEAWERFSARRDLNLRQLTIMRELASLREEIAQRLDRPPFKVLMDDKLLAMARAVPTTREELASIGLTPRQIERWGAEVLAAVARGVEAPAVKRKQAPRPDDAMLKRLEKLKLWRKKVGEEMGVESDIILPRPYLLCLAENGGHDLKEIMKNSPWRLERFGAQIHHVLGD
jgi:ribonuclease D